MTHSPYALGVWRVRHSGVSRLKITRIYSLPTNPHSASLLRSLSDVHIFSKTFLLSPLCVALPERCGT